MDQNKDLTGDIALAVKKLEFFSDESLHEKKHPLQRSIHLAKQLIATTFSEKARKKEFNKRVVLQNDVLNAIKTIQKNYFLIQKLKKGTDQEQALADSAIKVVERYNDIIKKSNFKSLRLNRKISDFIYKNCGFSIDYESNEETIHIPSEAFVEFSSTTKKNKKISQTAFLSIEENVSISQTEADAFRAKVVSLLPSQEIRFTSVKEEFQTIRSTPIHARTDSIDLKKIIMSQIVKPFPGETITFKGEFLRSHNKSMPVKESFELLTNSYQTGFPHALQYTGWALSDVMIPLCPLKLNVLKNFEPVFKLKPQIATSLLPKGDLNLKAKDILKLKKLCFEENKEELIALHLDLKRALYQASPYETQAIDGLTIIQDYFEMVAKLQHPYTFLTEIDECITEHFILKPFETLKDAFIYKKTEDLTSISVKKRFLAALEILENEQLKALQTLQNKQEGKFICLVGSLLSTPCNQIILQHMSETIGFHPPKLEAFDKKIQLCLYKQLLFFQNELSFAKQERVNIQNALFNQLRSDILIFKEDLSLVETIPLAILNELETYYENQFYTNG